MTTSLQNMVISTSYAGCGRGIVAIKNGVPQEVSYDSSDKNKKSREDFLKEYEGCSFRKGMISSWEFVG